VRGQLGRPWAELVAAGHAVRAVTPAQRAVRVPLERGALLALGRAGGAVTARRAAFLEGRLPS
jgi:prephenate dehydrogenase